MLPLPIVGPSYTARSRNFDAARTVNLYPEASESGTSKGVAMLVGAPGLLRFATLPGSDAVRPNGTLRFSAAYGIAVVGNQVYRVDITGAYLLLGTCDSATTPVSMASNGTVVMLVTGAHGYVIDPVGATVTQITDPDFHGADRVDYLDGYFVFNWTGTQRFQITSILGTDIDSLDFASAEGAPDLLISLICDHRELWLFGETSFEVFYNSGNSDSPIERIQGAFQQQGCAAVHSPARFNGAVAWLSRNEQGQGMVLQSAGYGWKRISTHAVELAIAGYSSIEDAVGFSYQEEGHEFYMLTFPSGDTTWVYDANTGLWAERQRRNPTNGAMERHRAVSVMAFANRIIVGDRTGPYLQTLDLDTYADDGDILPAIRQVGHMGSTDNLFTFVHRVWVDMETGVGLPSGQGSDPIMLLAISKDGGHTFGSNIEIPMGRIGERKVRAVARRLGKARDWVFRFTITDPVKRILIGGGAEMEEGIG